MTTLTQGPAVVRVDIIGLLPQVDALVCEVADAESPADAEQKALDRVAKSSFHNPIKAEFLWWKWSPKDRAAERQK